MAGDMSLRALAQRHGIPLRTLQRRSSAEGWVVLRETAKAGRGRENGAGEPRPAMDGEGGAAGDAEIAMRIRRRLLRKLEQATDVIPSDATEMKTQDEGNTVKLLKLRDLTAAYKDLVEDIPTEDGGSGAPKVIIDV